MRIEWVTVCQGVEENAEGFPNIYGALVDTSYVDKLGQEITIGAVLILAETHANLARGRVTYPLLAEVLDPSLNTLVSNDSIIGARIDPATFPEGCEGRVPVLVTFTFKPAVEGLYTLSFKLENGEPVTLPHFVALDPSGAG